MRPALLGPTPLHRAFALGEEGVEWVSGHTEWSALHQAAWDGDAAAVQDLLRAGHHPDHDLPGVGTPLQTAALDAPNREVALMLLEWGADPRSDGRPDSRSMFVDAFELGSVDLVDLLAEAAEPTPDELEHAHRLAYFNPRPGVAEEFDRVSAEIVSRKAAREAAADLGWALPVAVGSGKRERL